MTHNVLLVDEIGADLLSGMLQARGMRVVLAGEGEALPGSYWGEPEAGLMGNRLFVRPDTPVHSALHEACHFICMEPERQQVLDKDAGGDFDEENAVCYLQILLAHETPAIGRDRMLADMDAWGYTFRLGSARRWFEEDAADARAWLVRRGIIDADGRAA